MVGFAGVFYPAVEAASVLRGFRDYAADAQDEVSAMAVSFTVPDAEALPPPVRNVACTIVGGVYAGDADEGMKALQPLRELGTPLADISQPTPFATIQSSFDGLFARGTLRAYVKSEYLAELSDEAIDLIARHTRQRPSDRTLIGALVMGGAINRVGAADTAYAERSARWMVSIDGFWQDPADDADVIGWVRRVWADIGTFGTGRPYLNFTGIEGEAMSTGVDSAFGSNLRRLAETKAKYDPENFFRLNNNIVPSR